MSVNATVCEAYPRIAQAALEAGWEFMPHTYYQIPMHLVDDERATIRKTRTRKLFKRSKGFFGARNNTRRQANDVVFRVSDEGPGIPADRLATLLEGPSPTAVGQTRERTLRGLSLVRFMVERHQGRLTAQSQVGEGSCFTFTIPLGPRR